LFKVALRGRLPLLLANEYDAHDERRQRREKQRRGAGDHRPVSPRPAPEPSRERFAVNRYGQVGQPLFRLASQLESTVVTVLRLSRHGFEANGFQRGRYIFLVVRRRRKLPLPHLLQNLSDGSLKGGAPGQDHIEGCTQTVDVGCWSHFLPGPRSLLGTHEG